MGISKPLEYDRYYHIYNKGIDGTNLFKQESDYQFFLNKYAEYIEPIADTYVWVLLKNHFHFLVRIKAEDEIGFIIPNQRNKSVKYPNKKKYTPSRQFEHLFNAYAKTFNENYKRTGSLFETPFRRIKIEGGDYFRHLVFYIHNNPVHHHFCRKITEYQWSSYASIISKGATKLAREELIDWFNSRKEFIDFHSKDQDIDSIDDFTLE
jgi:REP element-mobilizing transposase RayT